MNIILTETDLDVALAAGDGYHDIMDHVTCVLFEKALVKTRGNKTHAADLLKINRGTLNSILKSTAARKKEAKK
ncbi:helix-turn-helix domain-containing protein [Acinetobacter baumannii]|uniref:helix-turn-helix domain-containing protein n=1 Tax=Acinetobacter baumannii TaxID=470 RepID=UPI001F288FD1|nr:helix-turn-helix domain-containing protein [Acinetobacter baumannii]MDO7394681.1 helix-turn-helix domain-containing protein [Acinetobacter baumannii]UJX48802.1 Fis family transcriptional regulator [Acinetobacter baumannii]